MPRPRLTEFSVAATTMLAIALVCVLAAATLVGGISLSITLAALVLMVPLLTRMPADTVSVLVIMVYVLLLIPARLRIAPLGAGGTPAALVGTAAMAIWAYGHFFGKPWLRHGRQPLRWAVLGVAVAIMISYIGLGWRAHDGLESRAADRGILTLISIAGIVLLAADGIRDRAGLRRVLGAISTGGAAVSALGVLQFATGIDLAALVRIPGFTYISANYDSERSGFNRIVSTTSHPIEMSVVVALLLPLALHLGFTSPRNERWRWWGCAALIAASAPLTVSRTAVIALATVALIVFPAWPRRHKVRMLQAGAVGIVALNFVVPGLIGTLRALLFGSSNDPSLVSRQLSRDYVARFITERPILGRGFGTFLPERYQYLDNQVLMSLVDTGLVGLGAFLALFVVAAGLTRIVRAVSRREDDRDIAQALLAGVAVGLITWLTYDALAFPTSRTLHFLVVGLTGAVWAIVRDEHPRSEDPDPTAVTTETEREAPLSR